jgi:SAM-dependent methyltransferase
MEDNRKDVLSKVKGVSETYSHASNAWGSKSSLIESVKGNDNFIKDLFFQIMKGISAPAVIADFGCGNGKMLEECSAMFQNHYYIGIDLSYDMAKRIAARLNPENTIIIASPIESCPLPNDSVDLAVSKMVMHHTVDPIAVARKIYNTLKVGGTFLAMVPGKMYQSNILPDTNEIDTLGRFSVEELKSVVKQAGFSVLSVHINSFWMRFKNLADYLQFMFEIGAVSKFFDYDVLKANILNQFIKAYGAVFSNTNSLMVAGEYLTIECEKS